MPPRTRSASRRLVSEEPENQPVRRTTRGTNNRGTGSRGARSRGARSRGTRTTTRTRTRTTSQIKEDDEAVDNARQESILSTVEDENQAGRNNVEVGPDDEDDIPIPTHPDQSRQQSILETVEEDVDEVHSTVDNAEIHESVEQDHEHGVEQPPSSSSPGLSDPLSDTEIEALGKEVGLHRSNGDRNCAASRLNVDAEADADSDTEDVIKLDTAPYKSKKRKRDDKVEVEVARNRNEEAPAATHTTTPVSASAVNTATIAPRPRPPTTPSASASTSTSKRPKTKANQKPRIQPRPRPKAPEAAVAVAVAPATTTLYIICTRCSQTYIIHTDPITLPRTHTAQDANQTARPPEPVQAFSDSLLLINCATCLMLNNVDHVDDYLLHLKNTPRSLDNDIYVDKKMLEKWEVGEAAQRHYSSTSTSTQDGDHAKSHCNSNINQGRLLGSSHSARPVLNVYRLTFDFHCINVDERRSAKMELVRDEDVGFELRCVCDADADADANADPDAAAVLTTTTTSEGKGKARADKQKKKEEDMKKFWGRRRWWDISNDKNDAAVT